MPHTRIPPSTVKDILATADIDPEWKDILEHTPIPRGTDYTLEVLKQLNAASLPRLQKLLTENRPADIIEEEVPISIPSTDLYPREAQNRAIIAYPNTKPTDHYPRWPVIILFHGGGHTVGHPEQELTLARRLVQKYQVVVVLPSYRLGPEHPFPASINDGFETLKHVANDAQLLAYTDISHRERYILPVALKGKVDHVAGLTIGGTSAGARIAASIAHLYHSWWNSTRELPVLPLLTGIFLSCGSVMSPNHVPASYRPYYLSRKQNKDALPLDSGLSSIFAEAWKPDHASPLYAPLDQHPELKRDEVGEDHEWLEFDGVKTYFQVCGKDIARDNGLIYERVLREEVGAETRLDLYTGFGHVFWALGGPTSAFAELNMSKKRMEDSIEGFGWLLRR